MTQTELDKHEIRRSFERAAPTYDDVCVVQRRVAEELVGRLDVVRLDPNRIVDLGCGTGYAIHRLHQRYPATQIIGLDLAHGMLQQIPRPGTDSLLPVQADAELLPLVDNSVELVFSNLLLQWCAPEKLFAEVERILRPGGLLTFSSFGPDTLFELRQAWAEVDRHDHVHKFADMHDIGDLLLALGFADPVMDVERLTVHYGDVQSVLADLRALGAHNAAQQRPRGLTGKSRFRAFQEAFETYRTADGQLPVSYEVVYGHAWLPDRAPPRDRPGTVRLPLSDVV